MQKRFLTFRCANWIVWSRPLHERSPRLRASRGDVIEGKIDPQSAGFPGTMKLIFVARLAEVRDRTRLELTPGQLDTRGVKAFRAGLSITATQSQMMKLPELAVGERDRFYRAEFGLTQVRSL